jgi:hypothetical protein
VIAIVDQARNNFLRFPELESITQLYQKSKEKMGSAKFDAQTVILC